MVESLGLGAHVSLCTPAWIRNHQFLGMHLGMVLVAGFNIISGVRKGPAFLKMQN